MMAEDPFSPLVLDLSPKTPSSKYMLRKKCSPRRISNNLRASVGYSGDIGVTRIYCLPWRCTKQVYTYKYNINSIVCNESFGNAQLLPAIFKCGNELSKAPSASDCNSRPTECLVRDNFECVERKH